MQGAIQLVTDNTVILLFPWAAEYQKGLKL